MVCRFTRLIRSIVLALIIIALDTPPLTYQLPKIVFAAAVEKTIAAGSTHSCVITADGDVKCWGANDYGQLGNAEVGFTSSPVQVAGIGAEVSSIAAGSYHTCALTTAGGIKCWGSNIAGQLGNSTNTNSTTPVDVTGLTSGVSAIAAGGNQTCAVTTAGAVKCWGNNMDGELGDGTNTNANAPVEVLALTEDVTEVAVGFDHVCAIVDGSIKCWGSNAFGQLGDGTTDDSNKPVDVSSLTDIASIVTGDSHSCAVTSAGAVKCWGANGSGQLGNGQTEDSATVVAVSGLISGVSQLVAGANHTCALSSAGGVKCWGYNVFGQLGNNSTTESHIPVDVSGLTSNATMLAASYSHTCAQTSAGGIKCWGRDSDGQLGLGSLTRILTPLDVPGLSTAVTSVAAADTHTCAVVSGKVKCWGNNEDGQLGNGSNTSSASPVDITGTSDTFIQVSTGYDHSCGLTGTGKIMCWGNNADGQLGNGSNSSNSTPQYVSGVSAGASMVSAGFHFTCAIISGAAKCWGNNIYGMLGDGTKTSANKPVAVTSMTENVTHISAGYYHTCAVKDGGAKCWGYNANGQLGTDDLVDSATAQDVVDLTEGVSAISAGGTDITGDYHSCALKDDGSVLCWGGNSAGQLGDGTGENSTLPVGVTLPDASTAIALSTGYLHTCALAESSGYCWGYNASGQLGDGTTTNANAPKKVQILSSNLSEISSGNKHTCAIMSGGLKCWGSNLDGQLGVGFISQRTVPMDTIDFRILTGKITAAEKASLAGITVSCGTASTTTNDSGEFTLNLGSQSTCKLTPSQDGTTFSPSSMDITLPLSVQTLAFNTGTSGDPTATSEFTATASSTPDQATPTVTDTPEQETPTLTATPDDTSPTATAEVTQTPTLGATPTLEPLPSATATQITTPMATIIIPPPPYVPTMTPTVIYPTAIPQTPEISLTPTTTNLSIINGGFEEDSSWDISSANGAAYSEDQSNSGNRSMLLGITKVSENKYMNSYSRQTVTIPQTGGLTTLSFFLAPMTTESSSDTKSLPPLLKHVSDLDNPETAKALEIRDDIQYLFIVDGKGTLLSSPIWFRRNDQAWIGFQVNLASFAGQTITLQFGVFNDGLNGVTAMYVDDVRLILGQ